MNKNYIKPAVEVTEIESVNIMATSGLKASTATADATKDVLSKEFDFEDEEEEW